MSDANELQSAIEATRGQGLAAYRSAQEDAIARYSDAVTNIEKGQNDLHLLEKQMHEDRLKHQRLQDYIGYQEQRKAALERKIKAGRAFIRAVEDDDLNLD